MHIKSEPLKITPISGSLGAEISGVDLRENLEDGIIQEIRQALLDHLVIFFRDQDITPEQHIAFARRFGNPVEYPLVKGLEGYPEIVCILKLEHETINFGGLWHSDTTYKEKPPLGSILLARELPPYGGDTLFSNMYKAYDGLSEGLKETLATLKAINSSENPLAKSTRQARLDDSGKVPAETVLEAIHPVVRTHPETGKKSLFINPGHTVRFENMTVEESEPLLDFLYQEQIRPEYTCRFAWRPGSIAFWDNRSCQHNPINDYHGFKRLMHRVTLEGDRPR